MAKNRNTNWVALGTAGAIGAAAMYGVSRMNQNGTMQKAADNARQALSKESLQNMGDQIQAAHQQSMNQLENNFPNDHQYS
ncbi:hypothetical protein H0266_15330 [Halobacillus locisalis]|uniref:YtxH-like protein n=1 Tax=Halobacillus locisalis TaxID=220753 RepID=A0A838CWQ8_9BACI|nr:hypothetical protein [Halobacillus locisalis]MBA2176269.1 hypothetical protein [Halobacillus locisalis]